MTSDASASKVALITGGGTGLGRAIATEVRRDNLRIAIFGRRRERLKSGPGEDFHPYVCDVADPAQVRQAVANVLSDLGRVDVLVNCAGVIRTDNIEDATDEAIEYQIRVNLLGTINMTKACVPALKASKGSIINLSSALARRPILGTSVYSATKGGIESFTLAMALELGRFRVRVNCISPGLVRSEIYFADGLDERSYEALLKEFANKYLLGRVGEPDDVGELAAFLASDRASWITGAIIPVDSGYSSVGFKPANG